MLSERVGSVGHLRLHRPHALNALNMEMLQELTRVLRRWREDPDVRVVLLSGEGERGFCAGGDIKAVHAGNESDPQSIVDLWRVEYELDHALATSAVPVVSLLHGITMGGGMGLGCHVSHRVVTPGSRLAMPEVRIGMAPDVGGCLLLARAPGRLGEHLALTSGEAHGADAVHLGWADTLVDDEVALDASAMVRRLDAVGPDAALADLALPLPEFDLGRQREWIDHCYQPDTLEGSRERLAAEPRAAETLAVLDGLPPLSLSITLEALRRARHDDDLAAVLTQDLRVMSRFLGTNDLGEGIRSRVIDRSRPAVWSPATLAEVEPTDVQRHFQPLEHDLELPAVPTR